MQIFSCSRLKGNLANENIPFLQDDFCEDSLDLGNGVLQFPYTPPRGIHCQWLLSVENDSSYITLEFEYLEVGIKLSFQAMYILQ